MARRNGNESKHQDDERAAHSDKRQSPPRPPMAYLIDLRRWNGHDSRYRWDAAPPAAIPEVPFGDACGAGLVRLPDPLDDTYQPAIADPLSPSSLPKAVGGSYGASRG